MLKSKKSKIIIGAAGILAVLIVASICVTSIFKKTDVDEFNYSLLASAEDTASSTLTQIDYIIQEADPYKVLIIADNANDVESVKTFFESSDGFRQYVINDNRTIADLMAENKVSVEVRTAASYSGLGKTAISTSLSDVDMIFLYGKDSSSFTGSNVISEDLYECLHNYMSANKPMIISYYQIKNGTQDVIVTTEESGYNSKVYNMTSVSFKNSWKRCNTTNISDWKITTATGDQEGQAQDVIKSYIMSPRSAYIRYYMSDVNVPAGYATWADYWARVNGESKLRILFIYGGDQDSGGNEVTPAALGTQVSDIQAVGNWMIDQNAGGGASYTFNTEFKSNLPTGVEVNAVRASDLVVHSADDSVDTTNALYVKGVSGADVKQYDYIFIAPDTYHPNYDMSDDVVSAIQTLSSASDSETYILFGTLKGKTSSKTTTNTGSDHDPFADGIDITTNYGKLVDLSVTTTAYAKKANVLPVGPTFMSDVAATPNNQPSKIAQIVTLINKSAYKTHAGSGNGGGSGSISTETFRVLELEPCYPIDLELAVSLNSDKPTTSLTEFGYVSAYNRSNYQWGGYTFSKPLGNYYTIPSNVLNSSEIDQFMVDQTDADNNVTAKSMNQEYYDWDLSKAKLSYALGLSADQIELVQMSTEEFITAKADVADAYDLIYVGGNMSAVKNSLGYGKFNMDNSLYAVRQDSVGIFSMYCHNGELLYAPNPNGYSRNDELTPLNGNDLTYDRYEQMIAYIDAGMPIVFSNEIWDRFDAAEKMSNKYANRYLDPDSNMYHLLQYAAAKKGSSVLTNWATKVKDGSSNFYYDYYKDAETKIVTNDTGAYGTAGAVSVFASDDLNNQLYYCVFGDDTNVRPKFSLTTSAITYVEGDTTTKLKNHNVSWEITLLNPIAGHTYSAFLVQDKNDNGVFYEKDEKVGTDITIDATTNWTGTLAYSYPKNDFGAFNWKLIVRDSNTNASASTSSITVFDKADKTEKMTASILEIMPMTQDNCTSYNPSSPDGHTFYLDKNYQQSSGNPFLFSSYDSSTTIRAEIRQEFLTDHPSVQSWAMPTLFSGLNTGNPELYGHCPSLQTGGTADSGSKSATSAQSFNSNVIAGAYKKGCFNNDGTNVYMGKYKAELSVNRYDSAEEREDRDYNYMDLVSDMYDFNLDIMYIDDILYYAYAVRKASEGDRANYLKEANTAYDEYMAYQTVGTAQYNELKTAEDALRKALENIRDGVSFQSATSTYTTTKYTVDPANYDTYDIDGMLQSKDYFRFFYLNTGLYNPYEPAMIIYNAYYKPYADVHDKMVVAYRKYRHYSMLSYGPDEYLRRNYDVIVIGFMDDYGGDYTDFSKNAVKDLVTFTEKDDLKTEDGETLPAGGLLMTHDNMTMYTQGTHAVELTSTMRQYAGMDGFSSFQAEAGTESSKVPKYTSTGDQKRYFLTNVSSNQLMNNDGSVKSLIDLSRNSTLSASAWSTAGNDWVSATNYSSAWGSKYYKPMGYTDFYNIYQTGGYSQTIRYLYGETEMQTGIKWNINLMGAQEITGTTKATQVNRGVVTTYPFYIATDLRISTTHAQAYALNLENPDVAVWYTLAGDNISVKGKAGGNDYSLMKTNSSMFAASPKDGVDSYYIYSIGNIVYCGAGHSLITGYMRDNNDERRLFLNVLINMAKHSTLRPAETEDDEIILYDPDGETKAPGNVVKENATDGYYINVDSNIAYPEFGFAVKKNTGETIQSLEIFYDLDYDGTQNESQSVYTDNEKHFKIVMTDVQQAALIAKLGTVDSNGEPVPVVITKDDFPTLVTQQSFFDAYKPDGAAHGDYTYIVINVVVKDSSGKTKVVSERIKIKLTKDLLDLT